MNVLQFSDIVGGAWYIKAGMSWTWNGLVNVPRGLWM